MARLFGLLVSICISLVLGSVFALTIPVWLGRKVMALWLAGGPTVVTLIGNNTTEEHLNEVKVHELYTAACGLYVGWLSARAISLVLSWLPQGRAAMIERLKQWCVLGLKTLVASFLLLWVIPMIFGLLFELVLIVPLRVPIHQTPILFLWQDWALGVLYTKIACAVTMMGPDWFLRNAIEQVYRDGIRQMQLRLLIENLALPVIVCFGLALAIPYIIAYSIVPLFVSSFQLKNLIARRIYPFLLLLILSVVFISIQIKQFRNLYEHIKNDKYLVGQRLVNYNHRKKSTSAT